jgi:hypothetical protein
LPIVVVVDVVVVVAVVVDGIIGASIDDTPTTVSLLVSIAAVTAPPTATVESVMVTC